MGEYAILNRNGRREQVKLGTCEDLFYVSRQDILALDAAGYRNECGGSLVRTYIGKSAFRALLPDWSGKFGCPATIGKRDHEKLKVYRLNLPPEAADALREVDHRPMWLSKAGVNFRVNCPLGKDPHTSHSPIPGLWVDLAMEGLGSEQRAVYRCPFCGTFFNMRGHPAQGLFVEAFDQQYKPKTGDVRIYTFEYEYLAALVAAK